MLFGVFYTYRIRHKETGRSYYGMTCNVEQRWKLHKLTSKEHNGCHYMRAAMAAHGPDAFDWQVVGSFETRKAAALDEVRLLTDAERAREPLYNLRLPSDKSGLGNHVNFAWGKRMPWIDTENALPSDDDGGDFHPGG